MWQNDAPLVRLDAERDDVAVPRALHTVGARIGLRQRPVRRFAGRQDGGARPLAQQLRSFLLAGGKGQMDDVVGALGEVREASLGRDDVVRWSDEVIERTGRRFVVPQSRERT